MKSLTKYIPKLVDAHIHLFDHSGTIFDYMKLPNRVSQVVGFMDVDFEELDKYDQKSVEQYYQNFIDTYYQPERMLLLATGTDCDTMIALHQKFPNIIKGFGEIKCYKQFKGGELPFGNLDWVQPLCEYDKELGLPIYLHWYVFDDNRVTQLEVLLLKYPNIPFVLCHSGLSPLRDYEKQFKMVSDLLQRYDNLFADISYKPAQFFIDNPLYAKMLPGKFLIGSDINVKCCKEGKQRNDIHTLYKLNKLQLNCENTLKKIFKNETDK